MINCRMCGQDKDSSAFDPGRRQCKECRNLRKRPNRQGRKGRAYRFQYNYGITIEQYDQMIIDQNGVCKMCKRPGSGRWNNKLVVDHCHVTGKIRGLLCDKCNKGLGQFEDKIEVLEAAVQYLKDSK